MNKQAARLIEFLSTIPGGWAYLSGLQEELKCSAKRVYALIEELKNAGYEFEIHPHRGIRLAGAYQAFSPVEIKRDLATRIIGNEIFVFDSVHSTQDSIAALERDGHREGVVVFAHEQTSGRGRYSRQWHSTRGLGLYFSVLLEPRGAHLRSSVITISSAVAVANAINALCDCGCSIKWPNDVVIRGKKLVGILTEVNKSSSGAEFYVLGIGINIAGDLPPVANATSIEAECGVRVDRVKLAQELLRQLDRYYGFVLAGDLERIKHDWVALSADFGREITFTFANRSYKGTVIDLSPADGITVRLEDESVRTFKSEQISITPHDE